MRERRKDDNDQRLRDTTSIHHSRSILETHLPGAEILRSRIVRKEIVVSFELSRLQMNCASRISELDLLGVSVLL